MSAYRAFGDEAKRQALIADVRAKGPIYTAWLTRETAWLPEAVEGDMSSISDDYGLHPAFARLLPPLGAFGESDGALAFYEALFAAIPAGADTSGLARHTLLQAWTHPTYGRSKAVTQSEVGAACEEIVALVLRSIEEPVEKKTWRAARSKLASIREKEEGNGKLIDMMLSLAWDLDKAPGAAHDVMVAWSAMIDADAEASDEDCFSEEESQTFAALIDRFNEEAMQALMDGEGDEELDYEDFLAEVDKHWEADPVARSLRERSLARRARTAAKVAQWRGAVQAYLVEHAKALPVEPKLPRAATKSEEPSEQMQV
tara:strand:+ start:26025 stop:26969 length:945 start_codon:yes stop_codon:yes gene_type:complete